MPELGRLLPLSIPTLARFAPLSSFLLSSLWYCRRTSPRAGWMGGAVSVPLQASLVAQMGLQQLAPSPNRPLVVACLLRTNFCIASCVLGISLVLLLSPSL